MLLIYFCFEWLVYIISFLYVSYIFEKKIKSPLVGSKTFTIPINTVFQIILFRFSMYLFVLSNNQRGHFSQLKAAVSLLYLSFLLFIVHDSPVVYITFILGLQISPFIIIKGPFSSHVTQFALQSTLCEIYIATLISFGLHFPGKSFSQFLSSGFCVTVLYPIQSWIF